MKARQLSSADRVAEDAHKCLAQRRSAQPAVSIRPSVPREGLAAFFRTAYAQLETYIEQNGGAIAGPRFATFATLGNDAEAPPAPGQVIVRVGWPTNRALAAKGEIESTELPRGEVLSYLHTGPHAEIHHAYRAVEHWLRSKGRECSAAYELYYDDPATTEKIEIVLWLRPLERLSRA
jgi:effector-binding domain-containing protein